MAAMTFSEFLFVYQQTSFFFAVQFASPDAPLTFFLYAL